MDKQNKISIIVPVYNSEKYISKCLDSLVNQTYSNIEIIVINDGSIDNSDKIIKKYNDKRIKYYNKKNEGIGKTRNYGIDKATGEYVMFIDSDDYIEKNCCEKMIEFALKENSDLVVSDFYKDINGNIETIKLDKFETSSLSENKDLLLSINLGPCNKIYNKKILDRYNIYFNEELKYEDVPFVIKYIKYARKISKINIPLSYYCIHSNSETTVRDERVFDILKQIDIIREELKERKELKENVDILSVNIITNYTIQQRYQQNKKIRNSFINTCFKYMKNNIPNYKNKKYYKGKGYLRRKIESSKLLTKIYCKLARVKYK